MSNRKLAIIGAIFIAILIIGVNKEQRAVKSKDQIEYEGWLKAEEISQRAGALAANLPILKLKIYPTVDGATMREIEISSNNIPDGRERIIRLLQLIREAGLLEIQNNAPGERPGDIVLGIESPEKKFSIKFREEQAHTNVKAALLLKLMQEYSKQRIPESLQLTKKEAAPFDPKEVMESLPEELSAKEAQE